MGWFHPVPSAQPRCASPPRTPLHREPPETQWVLPLPGCGAGPWGHGQLSTAPAKGVGPPIARRVPAPSPLQPGRDFQSNSPKYVYNFLFQKGSFLFKLGPETFQGAERGRGESRASLCAGTLHGPAERGTPGCTPTAAPAPQPWHLSPVHPCPTRDGDSTLHLTMPPARSPPPLQPVSSG